MEVNEFLKKTQSVEESFKDKTDKLEWKYTDVLYSFLGIYVLGLYAFDKEVKDEERKFRRNAQCSIIFVGNTTQHLYSNEYIIKNRYYESNDKCCQKLNRLKELKEFLDEYYSIGNIIPIWPGGNENRGKFGCYDLPEFYFSSDKIEPWKRTLLDIYDVNLRPKDCERKCNFNFEKDGIIVFLNNLDVELYKSYLECITEIIKKRNIYFNSKLDDIKKTSGFREDIKF